MLRKHTRPLGLAITHGPGHPMTLARTSGRVAIDIVGLTRRDDDASDGGGHGGDCSECIVCQLASSSERIALAPHDAKTVVPAAEAVLRILMRHFSLHKVDRLSQELCSMMNRVSEAVKLHGADDRSRVVRSYVCTLRKFIDHMVRELHEAAATPEREHMMDFMSHKEQMAVICMRSSVVGTHGVVCHTVVRAAAELIVVVAAEGGGWFSASTLMPSVLEVLEVLIKWGFVSPVLTCMITVYVDMCLRHVVYVVRNVGYTCNVGYTRLREFVDAHRIAIGQLGCRSVSETFALLEKHVVVVSLPAPRWDMRGGGDGPTVAVGCHYRRCMNAAERSEDAMAVRRCKGCRRARYCSIACQRLDWVQRHHQECGEH